MMYVDNYTCGRVYLLLSGGTTVLYLVVHMHKVLVLEKGLLSSIGTNIQFIYTRETNIVSRK